MQPKRIIAASVGLLAVGAAGATVVGAEERTLGGERISGSSGRGAANSSA
jgi:hypothetical protein